MAQTTALAGLVLVQPLRGFTFALPHLASMRLIGAMAPAHLAATAQAMYAFGAAAATAVLSLASGTLYARFGAQGFLAMALLCVVALPLTAGLRDRTEDAGVSSERVGSRTPG